MAEVFGYTTNEKEKFFSAVKGQEFSLVGMGSNYEGEPGRYAVKQEN